jgi:hypothetical protein
MSTETQLPDHSELLQRLSFEMNSDKIEPFVDDLRGIAMMDCMPDVFTYDAIINVTLAGPRYSYSLGKTTVSLAQERTMIVTDLLDIQWEQTQGDAISRVAASIDTTGNNHPPLDISESEDKGVVFCHFRPIHPRARALLGCFLADLSEVTSLVDEHYGLS